jgi:hypothetical protein
MGLLFYNGGNGVTYQQVGKTNHRRHPHCRPDPLLAEQIDKLAINNKYMSVLTDVFVIVLPCN